MIINDSMIHKGVKYDLTYHDCNDFKELVGKDLQQNYGVCFYKNRLVLVYGEPNWGLVGGHVERGETPEAALTREVQEESNMRVLKQVPIGYQEVFNLDGSTDYQLRSFCLVEPIGKFEKDPAGSVTEIKLINPKDYKKYFNWGKIGDRIMERAIEIKSNLGVNS